MTDSFGLMQDVSKPAVVVVVDSDGCVLDSMELKHRKAFFPALDSIWRFEDFRDEAEDLWLRINLYSGFRGTNRFLALLTFLNALKALNRSDLDRNLQSTAGLNDWIEAAPTLSEADLVAAHDRTTGHARQLLGKTLQWTREVNRIVGTLPEPLAFPGAAEALQLIHQHAIPLYVASSANRTAIETEWKHAGTAHLASLIFGQEDGTKEDILRRIRNKSPSGTQLIMLGDAPGDMQAAMEAEAFFFPIIPGREQQSWLDFRTCVLPQLFGEGLSPALLNPFVASFQQVLLSRIS
jgi:phosphoglycolate phosphatase-like HAD superfamily hydrolase